MVITSDGNSDKIPEMNLKEFVLAPGSKPPHEDILIKKDKKGGK